MGVVVGWKGWGGTELLHHVFRVVFEPNTRNYSLTGTS